MTNDPIVDEVRRAGEAYFAQFKFDIHSICEDLRQRGQKAGRKAISLPPRKPVQVQAQPKKAG